MSVRYTGPKRPALIAEDARCLIADVVDHLGSDREIGGLVFGGDDGQISIISPPGPRAERGRTHFVRDHRWDAELVREMAQLGAPLTGCWHTHARSVAPSEEDFHAWRSMRETFGLERFLAIVVLPIRGSGLELSAWELTGRPGRSDLASGLRLVTI